MNLTFDYYHNLEQVELRLCNPDGRELFPLPGQNKRLTLRFNDLSEISFDVDARITLSDGQTVNLQAYDYVQTKRLVYATNIGWFQIVSVDEHDDGVSKSKSVTAESLQAIFKNKGVRTEERVYCFYNDADPKDESYDPDDPASVPSVVGQLYQQLGIGQALGQGMTDPPAPYDDWTITYIPLSLYYYGSDTSGAKCRSFKDKTSFGYEWMVKDVEDAFEVLILFDFKYKAIHVMTPDEVTSRKANLIYTFNNFMKNIDVSEKSDDIVTVLNCNGNGCNITTVNPTGTNYLCDFSYYMDEANHRWMSKELIAELKAWKSICVGKKTQYETLVKELRDLYAEQTSKKTILQEMSLVIEDLRNVQSKRMASVEEESQERMLAGTVTAESVSIKRKWSEESKDWKKASAYSLEPQSAFFSGYQYSCIWDADNKKWELASGNTDPDTSGYKPFYEETVVTAYQYAPEYDRDTRQWRFKEDTPSVEGTVTEIISNNMDAGLESKTYWYFIDDGGWSYCKLKGAAVIDRSDPSGKASTINYCGGYDRYIAYCNPAQIGAVTEEVLSGIKSMVYDGHDSWDEYMSSYALSEDSSDVVLYVDKVSHWLNWREQIVNAINTSLTGSASQSESESPTEGSIGGQINAKRASIEDITSQTNIISYFASKNPSLLKELNCYWIEGSYTNDNIAVSDDTTIEEEMDLAQELLNAGTAELSKVCQPRFSFSIGASDVTRQYEFRDQMRELELGKVITIEKDEGVWYQPVLLEISMNLDSDEDFGLTFANSMRLDDWGYTYADLISEASSTSRDVGANWSNILSYSKDKQEIQSIIKDPLNSALRAATNNMVNQDFSVDSKGILGRKKVSDTSDDYDDEQVMIVNNALLFTNDNWETAKTALGKFFYKDEDGNLVSTYGLVAETLVGSLIMGDRLKIENSAGSVKIDGSGIYIYKAGEDEAQVASLGDEHDSESTKSVMFAANARTGKLRVREAEITGDIIGGSININDKFKVDEYGNVTMTGNITWAEGASPSAAVNYESVFNALTNNGSTRGCFVGQNGDLYINANYISAGALTILDANGDVIFSANKSGNTVDICEFSVTRTGIRCVHGEASYSGMLSGIATDEYGNQSVSNSLFSDDRDVPVVFYAGCESNTPWLSNGSNAKWGVLMDGSMYASAAMFSDDQYEGSVIIRRGHIQVRSPSQIVNDDSDMRKYLLLRFVVERTVNGGRDTYYDTLGLYAVGTYNEDGSGNRSFEFKQLLVADVGD